MIPILFEDGEALVIDKPAGLPIERPRAGGRSLEDRLADLRLGFQRDPVAVVCLGAVLPVPRWEQSAISALA